MSVAPELFTRAKALVFDFDGTLVDSNPIKFQAFEYCFAEFAEQVPAIMVYCRSHHHIPRAAKFRHVYEQILHLPYTTDVAEELLARFAEATTEQIIAAPAIAGAEAFLQQCNGTRPLALLSNTPETILRDIIARRGWSGFFSTMKGAPVEKTRWLQTFLDDHQWASNAIVFFGDTDEDAICAERAGVPFVHVGADRGVVAPYHITDFRELIR